MQSTYSVHSSGGVSNHILGGGGGNFSKRGVDSPLDLDLLG